MAHHMISEAEAQKKIRFYLKIMVYLTILTAVEIAVPEVMSNKIIVGLLLTLFAVWKAGMVGWYYMHLNHERKWLIAVALSPLIAALYAGILMLEANNRPDSHYPEGRARILPGSPEARDSFERIYGPLITNDSANANDNHSAGDK